MQDGGSTPFSFATNLEQLLQDTKLSEGRERLKKRGGHRELAELLSQSVEVYKEESENGAARSQLLYALRILRNMCVSGEEIVSLLLGYGVHLQAMELLASKDAQLARAAAQLLANVSAASQSHRQELWQAFKSGQHWLDLNEDAVAPIAMMVVNCRLPCQTFPLGGLDEKLPDIVGALLLHSDPPEEGAVRDSALEILAVRYCFRLGMLPFRVAIAPQPWHAEVLQMLTQALEGTMESIKTSCNEPALLELCNSVLGLAVQLARRSTAESPSSTRLLHNAMQAKLATEMRLCSDLDIGSNLANKFLRTIGSMEGQEGPARHAQSVTDSLISKSNLIEQLLCMLAALGPIKPRRTDRPQREAWPQLEQGLSIQAYTCSQPYKGYRSDLVAVLANAVYQRKEAQDKMQRYGGVELMLVHCQVDEDSPFLREVALWGVRNLCEGNLSIQQQIEQLQVVDVVQTPEMQAAGVQLRHDPATGRVRLSQQNASVEESQQLH